MKRRTNRSASTPVKTKSPAKTTPAKSGARRAGTPPPTGSKQSQLIALLKSPTGATIEQMTALTGWQAHTVRGTISGVLRKRLGLSVKCAAAVDDGARIYRVVDRPRA